MLLLTDLQLAALPGFQQSRPQAEGALEWQRRQSSARYRFYLAGTEEEWFALRYDPATTRLLLLRRVGRDDARSEIRVMAAADVDAYRSPGGQPLVLDSGWASTPLAALLR